MRSSPPRHAASLALPLVLVFLAAAAPAVQASGAAPSPADGATSLQQDGSGSGDTVYYRVEAHDVGSDASGQGDYWFTWNTTGYVRNPPALLPAGTHVVITFVNEGAQAHNLHIGGGIDAKTEIIGQGESRTLEFNVTEDAPTRFEYWCDPHQSFGMRGNATSSRAVYKDLTTESLNVTGHDEGSDYWFTTPKTGDAKDPPLLFKPGFTYHVNFTNAGSVEHNFHVGGPVDENTSLIPGGASETLTFTVPTKATGTFLYWCDPHKDLGMQGTVYTNSTAYQSALEEVLGGPEHPHIEAIGVDYLAYWVGVIAFATIFIVYGLYFYLFKYGESFTTTDHKDRTSHGTDEPGDEWNRTVGWILFLATVAAVGVLTAGQLGYV